MAIEVFPGCRLRVDVINCFLTLQSKIKFNWVQVYFDHSFIVFVGLIEQLEIRRKSKW